MGAWAIYTAGRVLGVAARPAYLFVAHNYLGQQAAEGVAIIFLASALAMAGIAADPHRRYYARLFDGTAAVNGLAFYLYLASVVELIVLACTAVFMIGWGFAGSLALALAAVLYYLSEKIADEILRLRLFERRFDRWGAAVIARSLLQLAGLGVLLVWTGAQTPASLAVLALSMANFLVFVPQLPLEALRSLARVRTDVLLRLLRRGARSLYDSRILWALALASAFAAHLDRLVALAVDKSILPLFMLIVMAFSLVQMAVDFFYISRHRRAFLEHGVSMRLALTSADLLASVLGGLVLGVAVAATLLHYAKDGAGFPWIYVLAIAAFQASLAVVEVPRQILYWRHYLGSIFRIELAFALLITLSFAVARWLELPLGGVLALMVGSALARTVTFIGLAARADAPETSSA